MHEVLIAGAGPAGSVAALILARAGHAVTLVDPCRPVSLRVESLPPNGRVLAEDLHLTSTLRGALLAEPTAMQMHWRDQPEVQHFTQFGPWLLHRARLHACLRSAALAAGARLMVGRMTIAADGAAAIHSNEVLPVSPRVILDARGRAAGGLTPLGPRRVALPFSIQGDDPVGMSLIAAPQGWVWQALLDGQRDGAFFCAPETLAQTTQHDRLRLIREATGLAGALQLRKPVAATLAAASAPVGPHRVIRLGDAALARDPIGAHGLTHALRSATHAAAAARTLLLYPQESDAAESFLTLRHSADLRAARAATTRAYAEQSRHPTPFWQVTAQPGAIRPANEALLRLAAMPSDVPELRDGRISWTSGLRFTANDTAAVRIGPFAAKDLLSALARPGTLSDFATRLARLGPHHAVAPVLDQLIAEGALVVMSAESA